MVFIYNSLWHRLLPSPNRTGPRRRAQRRRLRAGAARSRGQRPPPARRKNHGAPTAAGPRPLPFGGPALGPPLPRGRAGPGPSRRPSCAAPGGPAAPPRVCTGRAPPAAAAGIRGKSRTGSRAGAWSGERGLPRLGRPSAPGAVPRAAGSSGVTARGMELAGTARFHSSPLQWCLSSSELCDLFVYSGYFCMEESRVGEAGRGRPRFHMGNGTA